MQDNLDAAKEHFDQCAAVFLECKTLSEAMQGAMDIDNALKRSPEIQIRMYRRGIAALEKALGMAIAPETRPLLQQKLNEAKRDLAETEAFEKDFATEEAARESQTDKTKPQKKPAKAAWECVDEVKRWQNKSSYRVKLENACDNSVQFKVTTCDSKAFGGQCSTTTFSLMGNSTDVIESFIQYPDYDLGR